MSVCMSLCLWVEVCLRAFLRACVCVCTFVHPFTVYQKNQEQAKPRPASFYTTGQCFTLFDNKIAGDLCVTIFSGTHALLTYQQLGTGDLTWGRGALTRQVRRDFRAFGWPQMSVTSFSGDCCPDVHEICSGHLGRFFKIGRKPSSGFSKRRLAHNSRYKFLTNEVSDSGKQKSLSLELTHLYHRTLQYTL